MVNLKDLFTLKSDATNSEDNRISADISNNNPDARTADETYAHWGLRICAKTNGSPYVLSPFLQRVCSTLKKTQSDNIILQQQLQNDIKIKISKAESDIKKVQNDIDSTEDNIRCLEDKKDELKREKQNIERVSEKANKNEKVKLILGLVILVPLTIYLFTFYGSTFYSAFFKDFSNGGSLTECMFDPNSYLNACNNGFMELVFVLCAPIIFLGLGFALHFFSVNKEDSGRFYKMGSVIFITFMFDVILAYSIGKHLYDVWALTTPGTHPTYGLGMAITDINLWAVIFCGFIVYMIWGIVFDMSMTAYNNMYVNHSRIYQIKEENKELENKIAEQKLLLANQKNDKITKESEKDTLESKLTDDVRYDFLKIRTEMTNFYTGWIQQMQVLMLGDIQMKAAEETFNNTIKILLD